MNRTLQLAALILALVILILAIVISVRQAARPTVTPTTDTGRLRTEAVSTFAAELTRTAQVAPTQRPTNTAAVTSTGPPSGTGSATAICLGLRFVRDVTIPDNTDMTPAQVFTKTWLVENSGSCPWQPGFQVVLIGGAAMGGSPFKVAQTVGPGGMIQVSIKMAAPTNQTGVVQGTWKMSDEGGTVFGDYLSVVVVVGGTTSGPSTLQVTNTPRPTSTP